MPHVRPGGALGQVPAQCTWSWPIHGGSVEIPNCLMSRNTSCDSCAKLGGSAGRVLKPTLR